jgi:hypothetical protein
MTARGWGRMTYRTVVGSRGGAPCCLERARGGPRSWIRSEMGASVSDLGPFRSRQRGPRRPPHPRETLSLRKVEGSCAVRSARARWKGSKKRAGVLAGIVVTTQFPGALLPRRRGRQRRPRAAPLRSAAWRRAAPAPAGRAPRASSRTPCAPRGRRGGWPDSPRDATVSPPARECPRALPWQRGLALLQCCAASARVGCAAAAQRAREARKMQDMIRSAGGGAPAASVAHRQRGEGASAVT